MLTDREPPHDLEAERALLGSLLLGGNLTADVTEADFFRSQHRELFAAIRDTDKPDAVTVGQRVPHLRADIMDAMNACVLVSQADEYAAIVRDKARLRNVITAAHEVAAYAYSTDSADDAETRAMQAMRAVQRVTGAKSRSLSELVDDELTALAMPQRFVCIPGFDNVALAPCTLTIIGARPKSGKSAFGAWLGLEWSRTSKVAFFSYEMSDSQIVRRVISRFTGLSVTEMNRGLDDGEGKTVKALIGDSLQGRDFTLKQAAGMRPSELFSALRRFAAGGGKVAIIDYLQLAAGVKKDLRTEVTLFSNELKQVALATGLVIVALSQLRRPEDERALKAPMPSELRESGAIEQDADAVFLMHMLPSLRDPAQGDKATDLANKYLTGYNLGVTAFEKAGEPWWADKRLVSLEAALVRQGEPGRRPFVFDGASMKFEAIQRGAF